MMKINWGEIVIRKVIYTFILITGLLLTFLVPPFQKPDEIEHFYRSVALSKGQFFCIEKTGEQPHFIIPSDYYNLPILLKANTIAFKYNEKFPNHLLLHIFDKSNSTDDTVKVYNECWRQFVGYLPNLPGILLGSYFGSPLFAFYLGRVSGFIFFIVCLHLSLKFTREHLKNILYLYSLLPMVLHQVSAISFDTLQLSIILSIFTLVTRLLSYKHIKYKMVLSLFFLSLLFVITKPGYYSFILLYFLIPPGKIGKDSRSYFNKTAFLVLIALICIPFFVYKSSYPIALPEVAQPSLQKDIIMSNPLLFPKVIYNSLNISGELYIKSLIGVFGWLDYSFHYFFYFLYILFLGYLTYKIINSGYKDLDLKRIILLIFILLSSFIFIMMTLYIIWTPVAYNNILGAQGRYFLPFIPFLIYLVSQISFLIGKDKFKILCLMLFLLYAFLNILTGIYLRYYNY